MLARRALLEGLEMRRFFTFGQLDGAFGIDGAVKVADARPAESGHVFATPDGGSIVEGKLGEFRRYTAGGVLVKTYGGTGVLAAAPDALEDDAVHAALDASTGRLAVLERISFASGQPDAALRLYSSKGKLERVLTGLSFGEIAFDSQGRLLLTNYFQTGIVNTEPFFEPLNTSRVKITRYIGRTGVVDDTFGTAGSVTITAPRVTHLVVDDHDGLVVAGRYSFGGAGVTENLRITRLDSHGALSTSFGDGAGFVTTRLGEEDDNGINTTSTIVTDLFVTASGNVLLGETTQSTRESDYDSTETGSRIAGFTLNGTALPAVALKNFVNGQYVDGVLLAGDSAHLYAVLTGMVGGSSVLKFDPSTLEPDAAFNISNGATIASKLTAIDATVAVNGRLLLHGETDALTYNPKVQRTMLLAVIGASESILATGTKNKNVSVNLHGDGVVEVSGTSKSDTLNVRQKKGKFEITVNGKLSRFAVNEVSGLVIHTGAGDDIVRVYPEVTGGVTIQGGAGNDYLAGSDGNDSIDGGAGKDTILGRDGYDFEVGGAGNDTLFGNGGDDRIFGSTGHDVLYGGDESQYDDGDRNYLDGGSDSDRIFGRRPGRYERSDEIVYSPDDVIS